MSTNEFRPSQPETCPWCGGARAGGRTVTVGPPPQLGDAHAFELHVDCADDWEAFVSRARELASRGARETLLRYPIENGTSELRER